MENMADNQYPYMKKFTGWRLLLCWLGCFVVGWVIIGAVLKLCARLFFLGWDLV